VIAGNFWATYCGRCLDMLAELKTPYKETASKGFISISIDSGRVVRAV
jgi:thiol-disulfide isomerase/thioredoxin